MTFSCDTLLVTKGAAELRNPFFVREKVLWTEQTSGRGSAMLEDLQTHRQLLFDFTANYLDPLNDCFARLAYLAGLRQPSSGKYAHDRLAAVYGSERVDQVLAKCHEELFERLLETPLSAQEDALRRYVGSWSGSFLDNLQRCRGLAPGWAPPNPPSYLTELYSSNLNALLQLLLDSTTTARSDM
jgi:hypothetical protein